MFPLSHIKEVTTSLTANSIVMQHGFKERCVVLEQLIYLGNTQAFSQKAFSGLRNHSNLSDK